MELDLPNSSGSRRHFADSGLYPCAALDPQRCAQSASGPSAHDVGHRFHYMASAKHIQTMNLCAIPIWLLKYRHQQKNRLFCAKRLTRYTPINRKAGTSSEVPVRFIGYRRGTGGLIRIDDPAFQHMLFQAGILLCIDEKSPISCTDPCSTYSKRQYFFHSCVSAWSECAFLHMRAGSTEASPAFG